MNRRAVLITGCDTGFGNALAKLLKNMGVRVFAGVLDENSPGAEELRTCESHEGSGTLHVLKLDVTDRDQIRRAYHHISIQLGEHGLWGLVNNAGILGSVADAEIQPLTVYRHCLNVNFLAAVEVSQVFLPLIHRSQGRIVNVCSMAGEVAMPGFAAYGASKAALYMFSRVMRLELTKWGIKVAIIQPAGFKTNIFGSSDDWKRHQEEITTNLSPDAREAYGETYIFSLQSCFSKMAEQSSGDLHPVLDDMCHALMSVTPRTLYTPGQGGWLIPFLCRLFPTGIGDFFVARLFQFSDCYPAGLKT
ncbi:17-beta-hydroxysteroid dehydrogenase type 2 [Aplochiton taeniatus]